jgi:DNA-binding XRE family transcriptional regulator
MYISGQTIVNSNKNNDDKTIQDQPGNDLGENFNPFQIEVNTLSEAAILGVYIGIMCNLSQQYCVNKETDSPDIRMEYQYPNLLKVKPYLYLRLLDEMIQRQKLKTTKTAKQRYEYAAILAAKLANLKDLSSEDEDIVNIYKAKTLVYFIEENKTTALAHYRKLSGKSQAAVAKEAGISLRQYQRYEAADSNLGTAKFTVVEKIAEILEISSDKLVKDRHV